VLVSYASKTDTLSVRERTKDRISRAHRTIASKDFVEKIRIRIGVDLMKHPAYCVVRG
jgi:hypothetical protein